MKNIYCVKLTRPVKTDHTAPHFGSKETTHLYVVASSFSAAHDAIQKKHPGAEVRGIDMLNYSGVPIVIGD